MCPRTGRSSSSRTYSVETFSPSTFFHSPFGMCQTSVLSAMLHPLRDVHAAGQLGPEKRDAVGRYRGARLRVEHDALPLVEHEGPVEPGEEVECQVERAL